MIKLSRRKQILVVLFGTLIFIGGLTLSCKTTGVQTDRNRITRDIITDVTNDPTATNVLAWMLGGSILLSSITGIYFRNKLCKNK